MKRAQQAYRFLASYGLSCVLFLLLLILTYLGTLHQAENGLYAAQARYFRSFFLIHYAFGLAPVPLPGGYLLMAVLFVNLLLGGIVRIRKGFSKLGVITAHAGILILLAGSLITAEFGVNGYLKLNEGQRSNVFESYTDWELALAETDTAAPVTEFVIHDSDLDGAETAQGVSFQLGEAPFDLRVSRYMANAMPTQAAAHAGEPADGYSLARVPAEDRERCMPGASAALVNDAGEEAAGTVWGGAQAPLVLTAGGRQWKVELRRRRWQLPFTVALNKFTRELYPGTQTPKVFRSDITKVIQDVSQDAVITMNEPLREHGYTLYQSSWGPEGAAAGTPLYSVFAVVKNPADQFPLYACIVITLGLALHFGQKLLSYLRREMARAAGAAAIAVICLLAGGPAVAQEAPQAAAHAEWDAATLHALATLPVLDEGRIKPLDTFASVRLLRFNGKRSAANLDGKRILSTDWIADFLFFPESAKSYKTFRLDNSDVAAALGVELSKKRDRVTYKDLEPARARLIELARKFSELPEQERDTVQRQLINLAHNLLEFELLCESLGFARHPANVPQDGPLAALFPGETAPPLSSVLAQAPRLLDMLMKGTESAEASAAADYLRLIPDNVSGAVSLRLFPPPAGQAGAEWGTVAGLTEQAFSPGVVIPEQSIRLLASLEAAGRAANSAQRAAAITAFHDAAVELAVARGEYGKINLEVSFHRLDLFYKSLTLFVLAFLLLTVSWLMPRGRLVYWSCMISTLAGTLTLAAGIAMRSVIRGRPPVTTLYETILFATFVAVAVAVVVELANRRRVMLALAAILGAVGLFVANKYEIREGVDTMPSMVAVLDTNFWLATHVTTITMGYGAGLLASAIAHVYILGRALRVRRGDAAFYRQIVRMIYGVLCFSLLFSIVGTVLGGIWANESWGRFWGWDPKENGALMIVLCQLAILHARLGGYIRDFGIALSAVFAGVVVAFSWFGVNLLGVGLHSYGFTSGTYRTLLAFYAIEGIVLLIGAAAWTWEDRKRVDFKPEMPKTL